ncbi:MAG: hypothetical protein K6B52_04175 [Clostridiales bacterium]|nr:hypothetical protein [Clostridiales bacterium]
MKAKTVISLIFAVLTALVLCFAASGAYIKPEITEVQLISEKGCSYSSNKKLSNKKAAFSSSPSLPSSYDSRQYGYVTNVKQQGYDNCWTYSVMSALESDTIINCGEISPDFSETHLNYFSYTLPSSNEDSHYGEGMSAVDPALAGGNELLAISTLSEFSGIAKESSFPGPSFTSYPEQGRYVSDSGYVIENAENLTDVSDIKQWIMSHGSVTTAVYFDRSLINNSSEGWCSFCADPVGTNHSVTVVGWDDDFSQSNFTGDMPSGDGAWLIKNSHGQDIFDGGYYWVSYYDASISSFYGFSAMKNEYLNNYSYNACAYCNAFNIGSTEVKIANIFTCSDYERLSAVTFYTLNDNITSTVKIYSGCSDDSPASGKLLISFSSFQANPGFHTVELPNSVELTFGEKFSVIVEYTCDEVVRIPFELSDISINGIGYNYTSKPGESFLYFGSWLDSTSNDWNNFYIGALTKKSDSPKFYAQTLSTNGKIDCNFYITLPNGGEGYTVEMTRLSGSNTVTDNFSAQDMKKNGKYYVISVGVPAKEYGNTITGVITDGNGKICDTVAYSVKDYCLRKITNPDTGENLKNLAAAILNYGAYAQTLFDYNADRLVNSLLPSYGYSTDLSDAPQEKDAQWNLPAAQTTGTDDRFFAQTLSTTSSTKILYYIFLNDEQDNYSFDITNLTRSVAVDFSVRFVTGQTKYNCIVTIDDIAAHHLNDVFCLSVTNGDSSMSKQYSVLQYIYSKYDDISSEDNSKVNNAMLVRALYLYHKNAVAYFG